jgi:hypothetical protein
MIVQLVFRTYNESNELINIRNSSPITVCRNSDTKDIWAMADKGVSQLIEADAGESQK